MSNSIWKIPDQKPTSGKCVCIYDGFEYYVDTANPDCWDDMFVEKWCDFHDLIAQADKAERLEKAVNSALISLGTAAVLDRKYVKKYTDAKIDLIKQLIKENQ